MKNVLSLCAKVACLVSLMFLMGTQGQGVFAVNNNRVGSGCPDDVNGYLADDGYCYCNSGYSWDSTELKCVENKDVCELAYGKNSYASEKMNKDGTYDCNCKSGYVWNSEMTKCVTPFNSCKGRQHYDDAKVVVEDNYSDCFCKSGYTYDLNQKECVKLPETVCGNGSVVDPSNDGDCICKEGYEWVNDDPKNFDCVKSAEIYCGKNSIPDGDSQCICRTGYQWKDDGGVDCMKIHKTTCGENSMPDPSNPAQCICSFLGYKWKSADPKVLDCILLPEPQCGFNSISDPDVAGQCICKDGYEWRNGRLNNLNCVQKKTAFKDVAYDHNNREAIEDLESKGLISGYPDGTFKPENPVNRAELLKMLIEGKSVSPTVEEYSDCFNDVNDEWYAPYVCYAKSVEWVRGYSDNIFKPEDLVTKSQTIKLLLISQGVEVPTVVVDDWAAPYIQKAKDLGLFEENSDIFSDGRVVKRAEIAENLYRLLNKLSSQDDAFCENGKIDGNNECYCDDGFLLSLGKECVRIGNGDPDKMCGNWYGDNIGYDGNYNCICDDGFLFDVDLQKCVVADNQMCTDQYGDNIYYDESKNDCICKEGFVFNSRLNECITPDEDCKGILGENVHGLGVLDGSKYNECVCDSGFLFSPNYECTSIVNNNANQMCRSWYGENIRYDEIKTKCYCADGYVLDADARKCVKR